MIEYRYSNKHIWLLHEQENSPWTDMYNKYIGDKFFKDYIICIENFFVTPHKTQNIFIGYYTNILLEVCVRKSFSLQVMYKRKFQTRFRNNFT